MIRHSLHHLEICFSCNIIGSSPLTLGRMTVFRFRISEVGPVISIHPYFHTSTSIRPYKTCSAFFAHIELLPIQTNISKVWGVFNKTSLRLCLEHRWKRVFVWTYVCVHALYTYRFNYTTWILVPIHQTLLSSFVILLCKNTISCTNRQ